MYFSLRRCLWICVVTGAWCGGGCSSRSFEAPNPQPEGEEEQRQELNVARDVDILFMIDNSGSMAEEQANLRKNFPVFIDELKKIEGGLPNIHMAVVSSDVGAGGFQNNNNPACSKVVGGDRGRFLVKPHCGLEPGARFIKSYNLGTQNNFAETSSLQEVFSCLADLGTEGCGFEHQLQSVALALSGFNEDNAGFFRPDAYLAIILITDEDDCSADPKSDLFVDSQFGDPQAGSLRCNLVGHVCDGAAPLAVPFQTPMSNCTASPDGGGRLIAVQTLVQQIKSLKRDPSKQIVVSAITGMAAAGASPAYGFEMMEMFGREALDVSPVCSASGGTAAPALRLQEFVQAFGPNGTLDSICSDDFSGALSRIGKLLAGITKYTCVTKLIDTDPDTAGLQADCRVEEQVPVASGEGFTPRLLPACAPNGPKPCWNLLPPGSNACGDKFAIDVDRGGRDPAAGTLQSIKCRTCAKADDPRCL